MVEICFSLSFCLQIWYTYHIRLCKLYIYIPIRVRRLISSLGSLWILTTMPGKMSHLTFRGKGSIGATFELGSTERTCAKRLSTMRSVRLAHEWCCRYWRTHCWTVKKETTGQIYESPGACRHGRKISNLFYSPKIRISVATVFLQRGKTGKTRRKIYGGTGRFSTGHRVPWFSPPSAPDPWALML